MGDVFVRNPDGTLDFVDRVKYMIKSGGENIYPAEIERVILQEPRVTDAAVVRQPDERWGESPFVFVARRDETLDEAALFRRCRAELAGYKQPKASVLFRLTLFHGVRPVRSSGMSSKSYWPRRRPNTNEHSDLSVGQCER